MRNFLSLNPLIFLIILFAAMTKRAQIPFSAWLPAAIAAPTPVSALVHSSTLVTAGVYLIVRLNFVFSNSNSTNTLLFIGIMTILLAGAAAMFEIDIKDYQDIRKIRIISRIIPLTFRVMTVANLSLCGLPFLSGFYSKDMILEVMVIHNIKDYQDI